jgi:sRNA-binding regulator protein Hfq
MEKTHGRPGSRASALRPSHGRVQPFGRSGYPDPGLTSHTSLEGGGGEALGHRRLIRPNLTDIKEPYAPKRAPRKPAPPEQTNAENFYYLKQMNARTPMVVVLQDGEQLHGVIEWYDRGALKVNRDGAPNLLVLKHAIKYMHKAEEAGGGHPFPDNDSQA